MTDGVPTSYECIVLCHCITLTSDKHQRGIYDALLSATGQEQQAVVDCQLRQLSRALRHCKCDLV